MKKYITLAALLAAGTTFANAADLKSALYQSTSDITGIEGISGSFSYTIVFDADSMSKLFVDKSVRPTFVCADATTDGIYLTLAAALNDTGFVGMSNGYTDLPNLTLGGGQGEDRKPLTGDGTTPATNNFNDSGASQNLVGKMNTLSGLALTFSHTDTESSSLYVTLKFSDSTTSELYGTNTALKWSSGIGGLDNLYINESYIDKLYLFDGAADRETAFARNAAAIPEPSAFGMLAGLGALALVASRRRRK